VIPEGNGAGLLGHLSTYMINTRISQAAGFERYLHDQNQLGGDDLSGKVKLKVEPLPTSLSTQIFPPTN
jgi:hypothetical protein